jgi:hypothetical protein
MAAWDGKERRRGGNAEELRQRITELQQQWDKERRGTTNRTATARRNAKSGAARRSASKRRPTSTKET